MKTTLCVCLLNVTAVFAQTPAQPAAEKPLKFDLADVHISKTSPGFVQSFGGQFHKGRYVNREATMLQLIAAAYGVSDDAVSGGPGWVSSDLFDIVAKVPDGTTRAQANTMLKTLLAERFGLEVKSGNNPVPRWVLTVAKGGSKLKPGGGEGSGCTPEQQGPPPNQNDLASFPNIKVHCRNTTATEIGNNLRQFAGAYLDYDVVDSTHLEGTWNADIEWTARGLLAGKGADGIPLFTAVEKQLGLKFDLQDVPQPSLAIVHVNRTPSPNPPDAIALSEAPPRFEAATIKPADPSAPPFGGLLYTGGSQMHAGGTLSGLISMALQIPGNVANDMIIGIPKSVVDQRWDILAKVPATGEGAPTIINGRATPPPFSVALEMLYGLLLEQFQLKTHSENREVTVYALTLPTGGKPKMAQAAESERAGCKPDPNAPKPAANIQFMLSCKNYSMAEVARDLQQRAGAYIDHPVVDATGLPGGWDFLIGWTPKQALQQSGQAAATAAAAAGEKTEGGAADPGGITVFEAVEKQLGLKLVKQKRTIPVIVVDHVSEKPVE